MARFTKAEKAAITAALMHRFEVLRNRRTTAKDKGDAPEMEYLDKQLATLAAAAAKLDLSTNGGG